VPVQFDEREEETEPSQTGLRRPGENLTHRHREANVTAPLLDSTQLRSVREVEVSDSYQHKKQSDQAPKQPTSPSRHRSPLTELTSCPSKKDC
jgi:hypothetical protein